MIVIDSSAIVAIILGEPEGDAFMQAMLDVSTVISTATVFESEVVIMQRRGPGEVSEVRRLIDLSQTRLWVFDDAQARLATAAYERFGKGRHPAQLNLMDCAAYALARSLNAPLLYKGEDFSRTDVVSALTAG